MKDTSLIKLIFLYLKLPAELRGSVNALINSGIEWEKKYHDQERNKRSEKNTSQCR